MRSFTGGTFVAGAFLALAGAAPSTAGGRSGRRLLPRQIHQHDHRDRARRRLRPARAAGRRATWAGTSRAIPPSCRATCRAASASRRPTTWRPSRRRTAPRCTPSCRTCRAIRRSAAPASSSTPASSSGSATPPTRRTRIVSWHTTGIRTIQDVDGRASSSSARPARRRRRSTIPRALNELAGTKFKIVTGYPGGNPVNLAMERGEVGGRVNSWASWKATKPDWLREKKIFVIVQIALKRDPELADVPTDHRAGQDRRGQGGDDLPLRRYPDQPRLCDDAGRAARARAGAAPRLRRHHEGSAVPRRGGKDSTWTSVRRPARRRRNTPT